MKEDEVKIGMQVDFKVYDGDGDDFFWETGTVVGNAESAIAFDVSTETGLCYLLWANGLQPHNESRFNDEAITEPIQSYREDLLHVAIRKVIGEGFVNGTIDGIEYLHMTAQEFWNAVHEKYEENHKKSKNQIG